MGKPKNKVKIEWSSNFSYAIGLLTTDGNLSPDGRHMDFTSNDLEQLENFKKCLDIENKIGYKTSGYSGKKSPHIQFGDVNFYKFLLVIGLMPKKSKIIGKVKIPKEYLFDFLRGHLDGDGTFHSYWDPRWRSSFMFYTIFMSASKKHINWLRKIIFRELKIRGHISKSINDSTYKLKYAKKESLILLPKIYYHNNLTFLSRKLLKIRQALAIIGKSV